ncbi:MAG: ABC transporter permease, partial [Thermoanaerobaculia bacterium]
MRRAGAFARLLRALVVRPLLREPFRAGLTIAGVAVGVAVIVAIQLANRSALRSFEESVDAVAGRANFQLAPAAGSLDEDLLLRLAPLWHHGVRFAPVVDVEVLLLPSGLPLRILGVDLLSDLHFRDYRWTSIATSETEAKAIGANEEPPLADFLRLFEHDSAILPETFAGEHRLPIGSSFRILYRDRRADLTVRGVLRPTGPATAFNGSIAILDIAAAQSALGLEGRLSRIDLILPEPVPEEIERFLRETLPEGVALERPSRRNERVTRMLRAFRVNLFALAAVALLVGVFLVYNTVTISILRRRRDVGVLKAMGVSGRQVLLAFLSEGLVFGAAGSALGVVLGWLLAHGALELVARTIDRLYVAAPPSEVVMLPSVAAFAIAIGTVVSVAAAAHPAWEASRLRPGALIRPGLYQRVAKARTLVLALAAAAALVVAWLLTLAPAVAGLPIAGYASAVLVIAAFSLLAPLALRGVARGLSGALGSAFGLPGTLAAAS